MAAIVEVIVNDRQLQLGREQFMRRMGIAEKWYKIRIGIRYNIAGIGTFATGWGFGVCRNNMQYYDADADMAFWSFGYFPGFSGAMAYGADYFLGNFNVTYNATKVGSTVTTSGIGSNSQSLYFAGPVNRGFILLDITRSSATTLSFQPWQKNTTAWTDQSQGSFLYAMQQESTPGTVSTSSSPSGNVNYFGSGQLDSVFIFWGHSIPVINISDVAVTRFY